jgi:nucleoside-diphosphate-sugar epimerase
MPKKSVMIVGATGFIGKHLVASAPDDVEIWSPCRNDLEGRSSMHLAEYIIHAAGYAAPSIFMKNPEDTILVNTKTTVDLFECLVSDRCHGFLYCSSSEVYKGLSHYATEDEIGTTTPYHPRAAYIEGKRCGEVIVNAQRSKGIRAMSARIGLTYGPGTRKHDARVMNQFIEQALTTGKIQLIDDGSSGVCYCYANDLMKMLWRILLHGTEAVYNVGGQDRMSIAELAMKISALTGASVMLGNQPGVPQTKMNLQRYTEEFGPPEYTDFDEGLKATIDFQRKLYQ